MSKDTSTLAGLRKEIDKIDKNLVKLLSERHRLAQEIQRVKKEEDATPHDSMREEDILNRQKTRGKMSGVPEDVLETLYQAIFTSERGSGTM